MKFNKQSFYLLITSVGLFLNYSTHANVKYIVMSSAQDPSASQDVLPVITPSHEATPAIKKRVSVARTYTKLDTAIDHNARKYDISPALLKAIIKQESNFNNSAISPKGARGLMQVMPSTAAGYGTYNLHSPDQNIEVGSRHLSGLLKRHSLPVALAAYNAGEGTINKYGGIPPFVETQNYVLNVLKHYNIELDKQVVVVETQNRNNDLPIIVDRVKSPNTLKKSDKKTSVLYISFER